MNDWQGRTPTSDSLKYKKDCSDFVCLNDGTIYRECRYCNHSTVCQQVDIVKGKPVPMESHYCPVVDPVTNETVEWEYYCTGMHDIRHRDERKEGDDKIA
jgi:hypothetical protein